VIGKDWRDTDISVFISRINSIFSLKEIFLSVFQGKVMDTELA